MHNLFMAVVNARATTSTRDIAYLVPTLRREAGLTQAALAAKAGVSTRWLAAFEAGKTSVDLTNAYNVYKALGYTFTITPRVD